jgi:hypothetical protein
MPVLDPINKVLDINEYANWPSSKVVGVVFEYDLRICMVVILDEFATDIKRIRYL